MLAGIKYIHKSLDEFEFNKGSHKILDGFEILQDRTGTAELATIEHLKKFS